MKKKFLKLACFGMATAVLLTACPFALAAEEEVTEEAAIAFADMDGHWAATQVHQLAADGVVTGVGDNLYAPHDIITFAECATLLVRAFGLEVTPDSEQIFPAVAPGAWYYDSINALALGGYIRRDSAVAPEAEISLIEAVSILYRVAGVPEVTGAEVYAAQYDWFGGLSDYEKDAVAYAIQNGDMARLFEASSSDPNRGLDRAEAAHLIYNVIY